MLSPVYLRCLLWIVMMTSVMTMRVSSLQCRWVWVLFALAAVVVVVDELLLAVRHEYVVVVSVVAVVAVVV